MVRRSFASPWNGRAIPGYEASRLIRGEGVEDGEVLSGGALSVEERCRRHGSLEGTGEVRVHRAGMDVATTIAFGARRRSSMAIVRVNMFCAALDPR